MREIALFQLAIAGVVFLLLSVLLPTPRPTRRVTYSRGRKSISRRVGPGFSWTDGLLYAIAFYFALPYFVYRFGLRRAVLMVLMPYLVVLPSAWGLAAVSLGDAMPVSLIGVGVVRGCVGCWIGFATWRWRDAALVARGWTEVTEPAGATPSRPSPFLALGKEIEMTTPSTNHRSAGLGARIRGGLQHQRLAKSTAAMAGVATAASAVTGLAAAAAAPTGLAAVGVALGITSAPLVVVAAPVVAGVATAAAAAAGIVRFWSWVREGADEQAVQPQEPPPVVSEAVSDCGEPMAGA
ncbi:hypothetical protein EZ242_05695 [Ramlibacter rhizophilus]|uniref:Uncharacterized protein n=1 Tax=Ramlibacter rhizophilus TaxID=1781167 RepID=A0A4Z0BVN7_9BURK|nr:hypothetical protein EZ242_05695 [Ramlibacter rhizophilus]